MPRPPKPIPACEAFAPAELRPGDCCRLLTIDLQESEPGVWRLLRLYRRGRRVFGDFRGGPAGGVHTFCVSRHSQPVTIDGRRVDLRRVPVLVAPDEFSPASRKLVSSAVRPG